MVLVGTFVLAIGGDQTFDLPRIVEVMLGSLLVPFVEDRLFVWSYGGLT